ncbi:MULTISPECIES: hypothetical protein [Bradyrhizobium]|uniref:Uncharacterized protein n=1 Tax=Bradyrhizobium brasilense TaxID=1419277 RepID=A0ABY8JF00_9BRAD|nr:MULTISPECIES: hypothetical protein [Bradyrhizobium]KRP87347.1 hypothetical protein AOQ73_32985 [Bradyrhizobium pachyrhizi]MCP1836896.1 hypothetical protein [Bradyrhizobium sp. USDA 4545]MCP1921644.1 hypothetical protein [Bradyrhizobium sp. USDA 4532]NLS74172.1 hypothetical protein [Bradyrhizobium brasilense]OMI02209.1 hypothetical protein BSN85_31710 [Bradyrhizobium brasilense]
MKWSSIMLFTLVALAAGPVRAAPPTVTPSPGYDARLQEQRAAAAAASRAATPAHKSVAPRHHKRTRAH